MKKGFLFDLQRCCIHDGPRIRTTVFLKGCPLHCAWCHNPESQSGAAQLSYAADKCIACGACRQVCPQGVHVFFDDQHTLNRMACIGCGACQKTCVAGAVKVIGYAQTPEQTLEILLRDRHFYIRSGGGITISGGEPLAQPEYCLELLALCRAQGIDTCVETSGWGDLLQLNAIAQLTDRFLFDYKLSDEVQHRQMTGQPLAPILKNLEHLCATGARVVLRCPIISGINDTDAHFAQIVLLQKRLGIRLVELMPYHCAGHQKAVALGIAQPFVQLGTPPLLLSEWNLRLQKMRETSLE